MRQTRLLRRFARIAGARVMLREAEYLLEGDRTNVAHLLNEPWAYDYAHS